MNGKDIIQEIAAAKEALGPPHETPWRTCSLKITPTALDQLWKQVAPETTLDHFWRFILKPMFQCAEVMRGDLADDVASTCPSFGGVIIDLAMMNNPEAILLETAGSQE